MSAAGCHCFDLSGSYNHKFSFYFFAELIPQLKKIVDIPLDIDPRRLDDGHGIEETLRKDNAVWHKSCKNKTDQQKLDHAMKRKAKQEIHDSYVKTRRTPGEQSSKRVIKCFFC